VTAPAVIPALVAYINTVVVKTLVVDLRTVGLDSVLVCFHVIPCYNGVAESISGIHGIFPHGFIHWVFRCGFLPVVRSLPMVRCWLRPYGTTVNKSECSKQALLMGIHPQFCLNDLAWDCLGAVNSAYLVSR